YVFIFFFQAEDGIRDFHVTGVQTCALPISTTWEVHDRLVEPFEGGYAAYVLQRVERDRIAAVTENKRQNMMKKELAWLRRGAPRSEERRGRERVELSGGGGS